MSVLSAEELSFTYQSKYQKVHALDNVSARLSPGPRSFWRRWASRT